MTDNENAANDAAEWQQLDGAPDGWQCRRTGRIVEFRNINAKDWLGRRVFRHDPSVPADESQQLDDIMAEAYGYWPSALAMILERFRRSEPSAITQAKTALSRALSRKKWREDGWEAPAIDVQEALDALSGSEVPEPSAEEWAARVNAAREKAIAKGYTPEHDAKHGVRHLLNWAIDYARRGRPEDSSGLVAAAIDLADIAYAELERLRHVADTMSAVSEALRTRYASDSQAAYFMRQIDAALEAIPEPQGEPSDADHQLAWAEYRKDFQPNIGHLHREAIAFHEGWRTALRAAGVTHD